MKVVKKIVSVFAVILTIMSCFSFSASAKNVCKEISGNATKYGGKSTTFYVSTKNTKTHSVKMKMTKGELQSYSNFFVFQDKAMYDYYEILVYGKKANGAYTQISKTNVKDKSSYTIKFSGYKDYKIKIYSWKAPTIALYTKCFIDIFGRPYGEDAYWQTIPTWKISKTSGVTICK